MAKGMQAIFTQVGTGSSGIVTFNNIPQIYTDLKIVVSAREATGSASENVLALRLNNDSNNTYSTTRLYGTGAGAVSDRPANSSFIYAAHANGTTQTANMHSNCEIHIANYTGSTFKQVLSNYIIEHNSASTTTFQVLVSGLWRSSAPITSLSLTDLGGPNSFTTSSTFTIYGIAAK